MEGDEIERQVSNKFQKISCNGRDESSGGVGRLCGWPSSRIVRVSRASGGKDRHSKVLTSKGLRDRRIRLSVTTAIEFYDLQDRLGYDQPSKAVEWLIKAAASSIDELPSLDPSFAGDRLNNHQLNNHNYNHNHNQNKSDGHGQDFENPDRQQNSNSNSNSNNNNNNNSSTSDTSKGSGLSLSRSENRIRARERARDLTAAKKEKEKESVPNFLVGNASFTDLLTSGINTTNTNPPIEYFQMPQYNLPTQNHHPQQQFSFVQENFAPVVAAGHNLSFSIASSSSSSRGGLNRGTLQSNLLSTLPHHHHLQRYHPGPSMADGSASANFPFFMVPDQFQPTGYDSQRLQLYGGGGAQSHCYKGKSNN